MNNLELIKPLLKFESDDDFYHCQILMRKKENPEIGSNSRVIKTYYIRSVEYLENHMNEIIKLSDMFNARAMITLNKKSFRKVALKTLQNISNVLINEDYKNVYRQYDRACGQGHNDPDKKWIIDLDDTKESRLSKEDIDAYKQMINDCKPLGNKIIAEIPSKNGIHLITQPFDIKEFKQFGREALVDIQKNNPTNLYIPEHNWSIDTTVIPEWCKTHGDLMKLKQTNPELFKKVGYTIPNTKPTTIKSPLGLQNENK